MIKSMTGFASLTHETDVGSVSITARSVNHRYLDIQIRVPQTAPVQEHAVRERVQQQVARGRVDLTIATQFKTRPPVVVDVDDTLVAALAGAARRPEVAEVSSGKWTVGDLLRFPQVVTVTEQARDPDETARLEAAVATAVDRAVVALDAMRIQEGEYLRADLEGRVMALARLVTEIARSAAESDETLRARLAARVAELAPEVATDDGAVAHEVVRFVARSDIHEELARLRAHIAHWGVLAGGTEPCGRKLDFLLQEMNREVNTIGAKADGTKTSELIVAAKAELEKLREQTQNVE